MNGTKKLKTLDEFTIIRTLGEGFTGKVKLGRSRKNGQLFALKILDYAKVKPQDREEIFKGLRNELSMLRNLEHPNIIRLYDLVEKGLYKGSKEKTVSYAVLEYAAKGEIFDVLSTAGAMNDNTTRSYFSKLLSAMEYLHSKSIAHRDIKPENLLLDESLDLKLVDFGFATLIDPTKKNLTRLGTERYMAPELYNHKPYSALKTDIFAAGVVLFIFFTGKPPFIAADINDQIFKAFVNNRKAFWDLHEKLFRKEIDKSFKTLIEGMLDKDPEQRFTFEQIRNSDWMTKPVDHAKALQEFTQAHQLTVRMIELENEKKKQENAMQVEDARAGEELSFFEDLRIKTEDLASNAIKIKCNNIHQVLEHFKEINENETMLFEKDKNKVFVEVQKANGGCRAKLEVCKDESGVFGVRFVKQKGDYLNFQEIKSKFQESIRGSL